MKRNGTEEEVLELWESAQKRKWDYMEALPPKPYDLTKEECYIEHADSVPLIRFQAFREYSFLNAAFSTRYGGISEGCLATLNLGFGRGDSEETVAENYRLFCRSMGVNPETLVLSDQIHDTVIYTADSRDVCHGKIEKKLQGIDGLMTNRKEVCLATSFADCVPLFFADTVRKVIAASHSGWRGTVGRMGAKTVEAMEQEFGSDRRDIVAVIGPSICQSCYEVSQDVADAFAGVYDSRQMEEIAYCTNRETGKYQLDLWAANFLQLKEAGLVPEHIHVAGICTCCNSKLFFSHRASHGKRGNLNGFISIVNGDK